MRRRVEDNLRAQWRVVCSDSSDSNNEQSCTREGMKYHKSPSLLPVVSAGCEPRSVDAGATEEHAETAEGGSPVVRVARHPESVTNTKLTRRVKAREFDGSFCIENYIVPEWDKLMNGVTNYLLVALKGQALAEVACSLPKES